MQIKTIDLFAGIGGIRIGIEKAAKQKKFDYQNVFTSEIDKHCIETYKQNFNNENIFGDISKISNAQIKELIPNHNMLLAGFPCQPFSQAGLRGGFEDTRGTLFFDILRILKIKQPTAFLLENVKNLKGHDNGKTLQVILSSLRQMYYVPEPEILNARDFGVPQNRKRIFIVGFLKPKFTNFKYPRPKEINNSVGDILEKDKNITKNFIISDRLWDGHKRRKIDNKAKGKGFGYSLFHDDSPYTNTISARYYKDGSEALISTGNNSNPRKLTPRECANLQGFPKSFKLNSSKNNCYRQFGNSVAVPVIKALGLKMIGFIDKNYNNI